MAEKEERKIPVFTVIKNGAILKNIFVINKAAHQHEQEAEEMLMVGRHPDCNIMLTHPSISRFHLQIHSKPSALKLSVLDLSSVHGTWVSGKRIESGVMVEMSEGDTLKLGGSTRVYKLHWVPFSHAYDMEKPFLSVAGLPIEEAKEEDSALDSHDQGEHAFSTENECVESECAEGKDLLVLEEKEEETFKSPVPAEDEELHSMDWILEGIVSLFSDECSGAALKKEIPSAPPMPENLNCATYDEENESVSRNNLEERELLGLQYELSSTISGSLSFAVEGVISGSPKELSGKVEMDILPENVIESLSEGENTELSWRISELKPDHSDSDIEIVKETENERLLSTESQLIESITSTLEQEYVDATTSSDRCCLLEKVDEDAENQNPPRKGYESETASFYSAPLPTESVNSSLPNGEVLSEVTDDKSNPTPQSLFAPAVLSEDENLGSSPLRLEKKSNLDSIWSRRGKPASVLQLQTGRIKGKDVEATDNAENKSISKSLFVSSEGEEDEIYTPDKENFTPNTLLKKVLKRNGKLEETQHSSKVTFSPDVQPEDEMIASDKENQTPKSVKELKSARKAFGNQPKTEKERTVIKGKAERAPFQSLLVDSAGKSVSEASVPNTTAQSSSSNTFNSKTKDKRIAYPSSKKSVGEARRTWTMVADTTTLMDKESRKSLELLQGLKGTQLIIPRMVLRELDCLKRRGSLFRRTTEASIVLDWIENCMIKAKWWIHIQSNVEEGRPMAPTPPATPLSQCSEGSVRDPFGPTWSAPLSARGSLMEIVSPTAEDHILDCALLFRKLKSDGQFILLSNDVTLKIKAMAEGLMCETAQEFRESLVNPFSERFMWADSSPRGQTWSVLDDVVLREKYNNRWPLRKPSKGDVKGLKLILLHNSHYGHGHISSLR